MVLTTAAILIYVNGGRIIGPTLGGSSGLTKINLDQVASRRLAPSVLLINFLSAHRAAHGLRRVLVFLRK